MNDNNDEEEHEEEEEEDGKETSSPPIATGDLIVDSSCIPRRTKNAPRNLASSWSFKGRTRPHPLPAASEAIHATVRTAVSLGWPQQLTPRRAEGGHL